MIQVSKLHRAGGTSRQAELLKLLNTAARPVPLLRTTHKLKNIVKSEHKSLAPEACFPLPHQEGSVNGQ